MKRIHIVALALGGLLATGGLAWAERHDGWAATGAASLNLGYEKECGACHMPFQPQFLPMRSWTALMNNPGSHFGDLGYPFNRSWRFASTGGLAKAAPNGVDGRDASAVWEDRPLGYGL